MSRRVRVFRGTYLDSVLQMSGTRAMLELDGVDWAAAAMATSANVDTLVEKGFDRGDLGGAGANDLFVAVAVGVSDEEAAEKALAVGEEKLFAARSSSAGGGESETRRPRSIDEALDLQSGTNVAVVSVPGDYAALEAHKALSAGLHVLLFSDNVTVDDEVELKDRAAACGRLVMGPGAGTAMLGGTGLGFANVVEPGRVGVVAAAGTGAQEAMSLLDRWGAGVSHVVGLGGRDLSDAVDGRMAKLAVAAMREDPGTDAILLVSKPPSARVAREVVELAGDTPMVASLVGLGVDAGPARGRRRGDDPGGGGVANAGGTRSRAAGCHRGPLGGRRGCVCRVGGWPDARAGPVLGGHPLLRVPGDPLQAARAGVVEHAARQALWRPRSARQPRVPRPG